MKKILCEIAFTADFIATNGEVSADKYERQVIEIEGDRPTWEEVEKQVFMPRFHYDVPQWQKDSVRWNDDQQVVVWVLTDLSYGGFATCLISYAEVA